MFLSFNLFLEGLVFPYNITRKTSSFITFFKLSGEEPVFENFQNVEEEFVVLVYVTHHLSLIASTLVPTLLFTDTGPLTMCLDVMTKSNCPRGF